MSGVLLIVLVDVEYPDLLSTVDCVEFVGFILRLKAQVFSLSLYKTPTSDGIVLKTFCSVQ